MHGPCLSRMSDYGSQKLSDLLQIYNLGEWPYRSCHGSGCQSHLSLEKGIFYTLLQKKKAITLEICQPQLLMRFYIKGFVSRRPMPMESYLIIIFEKLIFTVVLVTFLM